MRTIRLRPPAKINLGLRVRGKRKDGYHNLSTLFCAVSLHDELLMREARGLRVQTRGAKIKRPDLVERAATLLSQATGGRRGALIRLRKRIPIGGGLGGGSSDAAAALRGLARLWDLKAGGGLLDKLARSLGADVPFFLRGGLALGAGRGDQLKALPTPRKRRWFVLVLDPKPLSTPEVFRAYDSVKAGSYNRKDQGPFRNDLSAAAEKLRPSLGIRRRALELFWKSQVAMSGSGPTLFAEFSGERRARRAARRASGVGFKNLRVVHSLSRGESLRTVTGGN